jgi:uncharacterized membrane protein
VGALTASPLSRTLRSLAVVLVVGAALAACGDDDEGGAPTTTTTPDSTAPPSTAPDDGGAGEVRAYGAPVELGTLPGGTTSWASDVNDDGVVVGASYVGELECYAVWWPAPGDGPMRIDEDLPVPGDVQRRAVRINGAGVVLVQAADRAFVGEPGSGSWTEVRVPFGEDLLANDLGEGGEVVGTVTIGWPPPDPDITGPSPITRAFRWDPATGGAEDLGTLPGEESSEAVAVNGRGQIVGQSGRQPFLWDPDQRELRALQGPGVVLDLDDVGHAVGEAEYEDPAPGSQYRAVRWDLGTGRYEPLVAEPVDVTPTAANGVNDAGQVVGMGAGVVWVWDRASGVLTELDAVEGAWTEGAKINEAGTIVGSSGQRAVRWDPTVAEESGTEPAG